jgi:DNA-binding LacI/PurR family transcriptional regulator
MGEAFARNMSFEWQYLINAQSEQSSLRRDFEKLFAEAITDKKCSAWVCANDIVAVLALQFLERRKIRIPERISLLGFDDSDFASKLLITSYNFNMSGAMNAILNFILKRPGGSYPERRIIPIEGFFIPRKSTARKKTAG